METPQLDLKQYGIDIGLLISGLFGAILLTSKESAMNLTRTTEGVVLEEQIIPLDIID